jgi:dipeptide transport system substrate-binding protein
MPVARPYMLNARRAAELIQADFQKIGVTVEIVSYEWAEYLERSKAKDRDGAVISAGPATTATGQLPPHPARLRRRGRQQPRAMVQRGVRRAGEPGEDHHGPGERTKLYEQAQDVFKREAPWATLDHSLSVVPMRKEVTGFVQSPLGDFAFEGVDLAE